MCRDTVVCLCRYLCVYVFTDTFTDLTLDCEDLARHDSLVCLVDCKDL